MRVIPGAVQTLLKSRAMVGANAHNHLITIEGAPSLGGLSDPTTWTTWRVFSGTSPARGYGNIEETSDGRAVISYIESNTAYVAFATTVTGVLDGTATFAFASATEIKAGLLYGQTSITLIDGKLYLAISSWVGEVGSEVLKCELWRDTDGTGASFEYLSMISNDLSSTGAYGAGVYREGTTLGQIQILGGGAWVLMCPCMDDVCKIAKCCYSTNDGAAWTNGANTDGGLFAYLTGSSTSILPLTDTSFIIAWDSSSSYENLQHYTNNGANRANVSWGTGWGTDTDDTRTMGFCQVNDNYYMAVAGWTSSYKIYRLIAETPTTANIIDNEDWELITSIGYTNGGSHPRFTVTDNALVLQHCNGTAISGAGTTVETIKIRARSIEINRNKGMASSATIVFDNKNGQYSPDQEVGHPWKNVMWPNAGVVIEQGYGQELETTFTGTIDDVQMTTFPAEITLICRDYLKRAYDQLITSGGVHAVTYTSQTPEAIFTALATLAGWAGADIHTEATGLTIAEKTFANETYGDAFSWLADLCGFLVWCDEDGDIYFYKDDDDAVPSEDYEFAEGEDIISLGYTISDRDLYNKIIVIGDGVSYEVTYYNTYDILAQKKMIINASEATTEAQCQAIAEQAVYVMNARARICEFAAIANPYLQIGDTLTVTETTTLISELYKITDISTSQSPDGGYVSHITCYHYAAPAES